jgi:hypothetical protein
VCSDMSMPFILVLINCRYNSRHTELFLNSRTLQNRGNEYLPFQAHIKSNFPETMLANVRALAGTEIHGLMYRHIYDLCEQVMHDLMVGLDVCKGGVRGLVAVL